MEKMYMDNRVMIFGAKSDWLNLKKEIARRNMRLICYVVSSHENNPLFIENIPVKTIDEVPDSDKKQIPVIISLSLTNQEIMTKVLNENGFKRIYKGFQLYKNLTYNEKKKYAEIGWNINKVNNLKVYIVTSHLNQHKLKEENEENDKSFIQAGSSLTNEIICEVRDNTGINISEKNQYYCELTAGYWIVNNDNEHDYIGMIHYSRKFEMDLETMNLLFNAGVDIILGQPLVYFSIRKNFSWCSDENLKKAISNVVPEYIDLFEKYSNQSLCIPSNMFVGKSEVIKKYYDWLMSILFEYERICNENNIVLTRRCMGYIAEDLMGVYFLGNKSLRVVYSDITELF